MARGLSSLDAVFKRMVVERPEGEPDMFGMTHEDWRRLVSRAMESDVAKEEAVDTILSLIDGVK